MRMARSAPIARVRRKASCVLAGPMLTTVSSLLPMVSRSLMAAEIVVSSPGSSTSETPLRTSRLVVGSSLLTTVLGSGICFTQTNIFIERLHFGYPPAFRRWEEKMAARRREPRRVPFLGEMAKNLARFRATAFLRGCNYPSRLQYRHRRDAIYLGAVGSGTD